MLIKEKKYPPNSFSFKETNEETVSKLINRLGVKKATGVDGISAKLLKNGKPALVKPLTDLINLSITSNIFPD